MKYSRRNFIKVSCLLVAALTCVGMFGCSSQPNTNSTSNSTESRSEEGAEMNDTNASALTSTSVAGTAVVFFSCTGNTEAVAEKIAAATNGTLMRIEAAEPYSSADLDYNSDCRANTEQNSGSTRPAIATPIPDVAPFDTVYLGYPIWWDKAPRIILTFLENTDLSGKTIVPFCTSGSSSISGSVAEITQAATGANVLDGKRFSAGVSQQEISSWTESL